MAICLPGRASSVNLAVTSAVRSELGLACNCLTTPPGLDLVDQSGIHIGVNGHLLAGQSIEREPRRYLGSPDRSVRNHQELNCDQRQEEHKADNIVAAYHELAEGFDYLSGGSRALGAMQQDAAAGSDVQRQPEERQKQEQGGKDGKLNSPANLHRRQEDDD